MQYTASSAQNVGVKLPDLISYIGTISSVSRRSAETIGQSMKTIFSRYESVSAGKNIDDEGQAINDVEKTMNNIGVSIRKDKEHFKDFSVVLEELNKKWSTLNDLQKSQAVGALAGTRQRENLLILLDNMSQVKSLQNAMVESTGSAEKKFQEAYGKSTQAQIADFRHQVELFWQGLINSKQINSFVGFGTQIIKVLQAISQESIGTKIALIATVVAVISVLKNLKLVIIDVATSTAQVTFLDGVLKLLFGTAVSGAGIITGLKGAISGLKLALTALFATPAGWAILLGTVAIATATYGIIKHIQKQKELQDQISANTESYKSLTTAIKENNTEQIKNDSSNLEKQQKDLQDLLAKRNQLSEKRNGLDFEADKSEYASTSSQIADVDDKIKTLTTSLKSANIAFNETTGEISILKDAKERLNVINLKDTIEKERDATINQKQELINLIQEYQSLEATKDRNATQNERMSQIANQLNGQIEGLVVARDAEGNVIIQNSNLLGKNIGMLNTEMDVARTNANVKLANAKNNAQAQIGETKLTYEQISTRIKLYQAEMVAKQAVLTQLENMGKGNLSYAQQLQQYQTFRQLENMQLDYSALNKAKAEIDAIFGGGGSTNTNFGSGGSGSSGSGYIPSGTSAKEATKSAEDAAKKAEELRNQMKENVKTIEEGITELYKKEYEKRKQMDDDLYNKKKENLQRERDLYNKQNTEDDYTKNLNKEKEVLNGINASIVNARRDTSLAGQARLRDLLEQQKEQQEKIDQMVLEHTRNTNNQLFDDKLAQLDKEKEASDKALAEQYSDENISKMVNSSIISGEFKDMNGGIVSVLDAYKNFQNTYNQGLTASGQIMQSEFIDKWQQIRSLINGTSGVSIGVNFGGLPKYDVGTPLLPNDQAAIVHMNEAIIPAEINPFRGGKYFSNFMNMILPKTSNISSIKSKTPIINFNQPLLSVAGGISSELDFSKMVGTLKNEVLGQIMQVYNDDGVYTHA